MDGKNILKFFRRYWLVLVLLITFLLRLPSLFEPISYGDEAIYLTLGGGIRRGLLLYRDIYDNKPPLLYLLAAIAGNLFWFRFLLLISCLTAIVVMSKLVKIFFPKNSLSQKFAVIFFALISSIPLVEGNNANSEIFQILPTITAVYLLLKEEKTTLNWFIAGLLFSLSVLLKVPAIFDFAALILFIVLFSTKKKFYFSSKILVLFLGFILPVFIVSLYFGLHHQLKLFFKIAFLQNLGYLSSWKTGSHAFSINNLLKTDFFLKGIFIFLTVMMLWWQKSKLKGLLAFVIIWGLFSLFGATLSERPYPHYLIQIIPPFTLILAFVFLKKTRATLLVPLFSIVLIACTYLRYHVWRYPTLPYYQNFLAFILGQKDKDSYFSYFNGQLPNYYKVAEEIVLLTTEKEKIFVWGDDAFLYVLTRRLPAIPFVATYHIKDFYSLGEVAKDLQKSPPSFIIVKQGSQPFPQLESILENKYFKLQKEGSLIVFSKRVN
ncbi:MAG: hypothetical protein COS76_03785 [Candidatus Portnoybacteria bacterium CG06_land_8_20_14_3_00_39_12]|uniref:Glycosyltransferase RgtA/B/C/D-like domain-containing protein n=1 Tax=Candidatus Portnoybacteria bacterium CG06_land_8_20_14_3_00_39_12 TaxID=1974809 RepID=A0A2M7AW69_9BACT|nr:MAG: hypothetical protein COS76_03785 [Candidatus Portnoybacteria bacterium CG06_land_8_20_14_3_00_39_12]